MIKWLKNFFVDAEAPTVLDYSPHASQYDVDKVIVLEPEIPVGPSPKRTSPTSRRYSPAEIAARETARVRDRECMNKARK